MANFVREAWNSMLIYTTKEQGDQTEFWFPLWASNTFKSLQFQPVQDIEF